jgi:hypothetical protein
MSGRAAAKPAKLQRARKAAGKANFTVQRWLFIGGFTAALLIGLPLAHALIGDAGAILLGTFALGFVVGRMTLRR